MKRLVFIFVLIFLFILNIGYSENDSKLIKIFYYNRLPYYYFKNKIPEGFLLEITDKIFNMASIPHKYIEQNPKRILQQIKITKDSVSIGWYITEKRKKEFIFSDYIYQDKPIVVVINKYKKNVLPLDLKISDLFKTNLVLGVIDGFSYGDWMDNMIKVYNPKKIVFPYIEDNILKLVSTLRCDYTIMSYEEAKWYVNNSSYFKQNVDILFPIDVPEGNKRYLMFNKNISKKILNKVNAIINSYRDSNDYMKIIERYF